MRTVQLCTLPSGSRILFMECRVVILLTALAQAPQFRIPIPIQLDARPPLPAKASRDFGEEVDLFRREIKL